LKDSKDLKDVKDLKDLIDVKDLKDLKDFSSWIGVCSDTEQCQSQAFVGKVMVQRQEFIIALG